MASVARDTRLEVHVAREMLGGDEERGFEKVRVRVARNAGGRGSIGGVRVGGRPKREHEREERQHELHERGSSSRRRVAQPKRTMTRAVASTMSTGTIDR
jgi:hypothetical protein